MAEVDLADSGAGPGPRGGKLNILCGKGWLGARMFRRMAAVSMVFMALTGCSPEYNWRVAPIADGSVTAIFPGKPETGQRPLDFAGHSLQFSLTAAQVNDAAFAVGYAPWPDEWANDDQAKHEFARAVIRSLYQNLGVAPPRVLPEPGNRFTIEGKSQKGAARLDAKVWLLPRGLVEGLVTAPSALYPKPEADEFFGSLGKPR